jgi:hypothetical protein
MNDDLPFQPANNTDDPRVAICFRDRAVSFLFAELLNSRGLETEIFELIEDSPAELRLITESSYYNDIPQSQLNKTLIVGPDSDMAQLKANTLLSQPLTESKITAAFEKFFSA